MAETILFYLFAIGVLVSGAQVVFRKNPLHGALSLVACFFFLAGIYLLLAAELVSILQVMVYAGAVMVLFVFVIMLLNLKEGEMADEKITAWKGLGLLSVLAAVGGIGWKAFSHLYGPRTVDLAGHLLGPTGSPEFGSVKAVGRAIYIHSVLPFELTSLLLLVAVVGAVVVAKGKILMVGPAHYLVLAAILFALGAAGVVLRRNALIVLMSIELMLNAVNLTFLAFSRFPIAPHTPTQMLQGHAAVFFVIAVAACEAAVGLAIVIAAFRSRTSINVDEFDTLKL